MAPRGIELAPVQFLPDEPAKVCVPGLGSGGSEARKVRVQLDMAHDEEKECLKAENAALKERLLQQQLLWCQPEDWCNERWEAPEIHVGAEVAFQNLQRAPDLNGVHALVERWDESSQRWVVRLASGEEKFARSENLVVVFAAWARFWEASKFPRNGSCNSFLSDTTASGATASFTSCGTFEGGEEQKTTVMMRNIPNDYTRGMLLQLLDREGFRGKYDLAYLPIDYNSHVGFGYAFINFVSHAEAERFRRHFAGYARWDVVSQKVCEVSWSTVLQGVQAHIDRYRNSPVMHEAVRDEFKPVLFVDGERVPFPGPTKVLRAPRTRRRDLK